jgi:hypothetical protein
MASPLCSLSRESPNQAPNDLAKTAASHLAPDGRWHLLTHPSRPPPFFRQLFLPSFLADRSRLGFSPNLCNGSLLFTGSWLATRLQWPRWRRASCRQIPRKPQLLSKFLLLDSGAGLFGNQVPHRGLCLRSISGIRFRIAFLCYRRITRWKALRSGTLTHNPFFFVDKPPHSTHQMGHGNINTAFPENLRDPMHAETATVCLQDLFLILSQGVDLRLLSITARSALRAT